MRGKVILRPCNLQILVNTKGYVLFATLWDIVSSDKVTHENFCKQAFYHNIFSFSNTGIYADSETNYHTFDDGFADLEWLNRLFKFVLYLKSYGIDVEIKLEKYNNEKFDIGTYDGDIIYPKVVQKTLISTYFKFICEFAKSLGMSSYVKSKCSCEHTFSFIAFDNYMYINNPKVNPERYK